MERDQALFDAFESSITTPTEALRNADTVNHLRWQIKLQSQCAKSVDRAIGTESFSIA